MVTIGINPKHLLQIYKTFHWLVQLKEKDFVQVVRVIPRSHLIYLVKTRRADVEGLLMALAEMGNCLDGDMMTWDKYLYCLLRFASLTRVELAQWYFFVASKQVCSRTIHYLTDAQLDDFFEQYRESRVPAFSAREVFFRKLELPRYYAADFVEAMQRFPQLLNPAIHLQRSIRAVLPTTSFWNQFDSELAYNRKLTLEFFMIEKTHVFLRGEPPLRETCDLLLPEALGYDPKKLTAPGQLGAPQQAVMQPGQPQVKPPGPAPPQNLPPPQQPPGPAGGTVAVGGKPARPGQAGYKAPKDDYAAGSGLTQAEKHDFTRPHVAQARDDVRASTIGEALKDTLRPTPDLYGYGLTRLPGSTVPLQAPGQATMGTMAMQGTMAMGTTMPSQVPGAGPPSPTLRAAAPRPKIARTDLPPWLRDIPLAKPGLPPKMR